MTRLSDVSDWLGQHLPALTQEYDVPGAAVAVLADGEVVDRATGILSKSTGVEATTDTVFQIGSITKLWTSTLVMQLVDAGKVDLDTPIRAYLPDFRLPDEEAAAQVTTRHLLTHTSGFEGDIFTDTGVGDDAVEKWFATTKDIPQVFPPGAMWSYNNAGFCVLGRLLEVLHGSPFDAVLREHLITPLGLQHVATSPYEAIMFRAAVGHIEKSPGSGFETAPYWALARSNISAGAMLAMSPRDLLVFARMQLDAGKTADGSQVLAPGTAASMHAHQVTLPDLGRYADSWGLGFERFTVPEGLILGHDGGTIGQSAFLRIVPDAGVAVALLTNGGNVGSLYRDVVGHVLDELTDTHLPPDSVPPAEPRKVDAERYVGTYTCAAADVTISQDDDGRIWLDETPKGMFEELEEPQRRELVYYRDDNLITAKAERGMHTPHVFMGDDGTGHSLYMHSGRALRRATAS
jgi:CubicO group peptidase (beta-lactamase class C family)